MSKINKRQTIYLDPAIHKVLKAKSLMTGLSISELVNQALCLDLLEDLLSEEKLKIKNVLKSSLSVDGEVCHKNH